MGSPARFDEGVYRRDDRRYTTGQPVPDRGSREWRRVRPATADQLFERFCRGSSSRTADGSGSGIGLTIAKAIVQAHHGQLRGHSDGPGTGARFEITLPIADSGNHPRSRDQTQSRLS